MKPNPPLTGNPLYDQPCTMWVDAVEGEPERPSGFCGAMPSKVFLNYRACINHTPAAIAGREEPTVILARARKMYPDLPKPPPEPEPVSNVVQFKPGANDVPPLERSIAAAEARAATKADVAEMKAQARAAARASATG